MFDPFAWKWLNLFYCKNSWQSLFFQPADQLINFILQLFSIMSFIRLSAHVCQTPQSHFVTQALKSWAQANIILMTSSGLFSQNVESCISSHIIQQFSQAESCSPRHVSWTLGVNSADCPFLRHPCLPSHTVTQSYMPNNTCNELCS